MELTGETVIPADRETVWEALNDPETLKRSIHGCQSLEQETDGGFKAAIRAKVGPLQAVLNGKVTLSNLNPPESYTLTGEGSLGAAGFAKGSADVSLATVPEGTKLSYTAQAQVGGKLAALGSRLVQQAAAKQADAFFAAFAKNVAAEVTAAAAPVAPATAASPQAAVLGTWTNPPSWMLPVSVGTWVLIVLMILLG